MLIAAVQHDIVWEDAAATRAALEGRMAAAAQAGARMVVLAEMFATGFSLNAQGVAEAPDGPSVTWMTEQAGALGTWVIGSLPINTGEGRPLNRLIAAGPAGQLTTYDKRHPFSFGREPEEYDAGDALATVTVDGMVWGLSVCYDLRFSYDYWNRATEVDGYLVVANWPRPRREHWQALLRARAIENLAYVVGVNRVGTDGAGLDYAGDSAVISPNGDVLAAASEREVVLLVDLDPGGAAATREHFGFLADRRD
ncbi:MAG: nitrilase-related carbon-nitrogen hydrolase [Microthrixaceae bacterium]